MRVHRLVTIGLLCAASVASAGCGRQAVASAAGQAAPSATHPAASSATARPSIPVLHAHPQAIEPVAGAVSPSARSSGNSSGSPSGNASGTPSGNASGTPSGNASGGVAAVSVGPPSSSLPQPASITDVRDQLARSGMSASPNQATLTPAGLAVAPIDAPAAVQEVIAAGNQIARLPYRYGGGHLTYEDTAYDCSGSISYVFAAAHLLGQTVVSGQLENWGKPGPGRWITVFANAGHTFMYVAGLRFDTVALAETGSRWSDHSADEPDLRTFAVRHPAGL